jgi:hypothetical protein
MILIDCTTGDNVNGGGTLAGAHRCHWSCEPPLSRLPKGRQMDISATPGRISAPFVLADALSAIAGVVLVGSTFMTTFVVDERVGRFDVSQGMAHDCTAWVHCPSNGFAPDQAIGWVALLAAAVAIGLPVVRALTGRPPSRRVARWQLTGSAVLLAVMALAAGLAVFHARAAGYNEWNYVLHLKPAGGTVVMFVAMLVALLSAVLVKVRTTNVR